MDFSVVDWGALATIGAAFIAAATAVCISNQWRSQKGAEVIANEAKRLLAELAELRLLIKKISSHTLSNEDSKRAVKSFDFQEKTIGVIIDFLFEEIIDERKNSLIDMKNELNEINELLNKYTLDNDIRFLFFISMQKEEGINTFGALFNSIEKSETLLRELALYKSR